MVKGVIFDIGGVLAFDIVEYLFDFDNCAIVDKYHLDARNVKEASKALWLKYTHTEKDNEDIWQEVEQEYWNEFKYKTGLSVANEELIQLSKKYIRPVEGMNSLLNWLNKNEFDLLICSNNTEFFFQRQKKIADFGKYFEKRKIILSNHYGVPKHEETLTLFREVEKQMDYPKKDYLFVDDRVININAGLKFGIAPLLFPAEATYGHIYVKKIIEKMNNV